jgi:excisionase family DNA binding protein
MKHNFTIKKTADLLGVSEKTAYRMVADGEICAFKCRGSLRITEESLEIYRARQIIAFQEENDIEQIQN